MPMQPPAASTPESGTAENLPELIGKTATEAVSGFFKDALFGTFRDVGSNVLQLFNFFGL